MNITIPFKTPTINHLYGQRGYRKFLTKEAKELREEIDQIVHDRPVEELEVLPEDQPLKVIVTIHENWFTKDGDIKRVDIANREKFLIDSVFNSLGIDDKTIFHHSMIKIQDDDHEYAEIAISEAGS